MRHRLRREHDIDGGLPVVFSTERPKVKLLPFKGPTGEEANPADYQVRRTLGVWMVYNRSLQAPPANVLAVCLATQVVPGFRVRIIPVLGTVPAIFGQVMATYVVTQIASMSLQLEPVVNLDVDHYGLLHNRLIEREELLFGSAAEVEVFVCTLHLVCSPPSQWGAVLPAAAIRPSVTKQACDWLVAG